MNLIAIALKNMYDKMNLYNKYLNKDLYEFRFDNKIEIDKPLFKCINKKTNEIELSGSYTSIGFFFYNESLWVWSWYRPINKNNEIYIAKELLNYGLNYEYSGPENKNVKNIYTSIIRELLISGKNKILHKIQLYIILALSLYFTKYDFIYKTKVMNNNHYVLLKIN